MVPSYPPTQQRCQNSRPEMSVWVYLLREELARVRRETNEAIRELRDDLHAVAEEVQRARDAGE